MLMMLLAVLLSAGFSLSAAQASIMSAKMTEMTGMAMAADAGMATDTAMNGDCGACLKGAGDNGNPMQCPPSCIAPVLAVLPQGLAITLVPLPSQPSALPTPVLHGRSALPDPSPPKPSNHA
ncbi:hypothetical protein [Mesorhizobium sp.]|uniref:hypothetical protein n=1 Tax=Mesorhizobium sp. TaxID=1871066 RepID=UPI0025D7AC38|nr:hypothetical protein [Mesorhizobium sp.]